MFLEIAFYEVESLVGFTDDLIMFHSPKNPPCEGFLVFAQFSLKKSKTD